MKTSKIIFAATCIAITFVSVLTFTYMSSKNSVEFTGETELVELETDTDASSDAPLASEVVIPCEAKVLVYHHISDMKSGPMFVSPKAVEKQFTYLREQGYHVIALRELVDCMEKGSILPSKAVVLTFDDRWVSQYKYAFPLLKKNGYTATFFVPTAMDIQLCSTWDQLREMSKSGMAIESHTRTHPYLTRTWADAALALELEGSFATIKKEIGIEPQFLAYPYGMSDTRVEAASKKAGYRAARSVYPGYKHMKSDMFNIKAYGVPEYHQAFVKMMESM